MEINSRWLRNTAYHPVPRSSSSDGIWWLKVQVVCVAISSVHDGGAAGGIMRTEVLLLTELADGSTLNSLGNNW